MPICGNSKDLRRQLVPTVTIDGERISMPAESTILEAGRKAGTWIPALCDSPVMTSLATCRLCMVEIESKGRTRLVTACNYPVHDDMEIRTNSQRAQRARMGVMQLLLARCPESEELREVAARMGVDSTPYPTVTDNQRNCILCGLCVSVCEEVIGVSAIGFAGRGVKRTVAAPFRQPSEDCIGCGACAAVCPVGTIQVRIHEAEGEVEISPFKSRSPLLTCHECGTRMVTQPVATQAFAKGKVDWEAFRKRARLCPECRRKHTAASIGFLATKGVGSQTASPSTNNTLETAKPI